MTIPLKQKTWYTLGNAQYPDTSMTSSICDSAVFMLKSMLLGECMSGTTGPEGTRPTGSYWTIYGSSNGVTAGLDGVDRWGTQFTASNYIHAASGSAHSWITLRSPMQLGPVYMTIDLNTTTKANACIAYSYALPYVTGTVRGRPVHNPEWSLGTTTTTSAVAIVGNPTTGIPHRAHITIDGSGSFHFLTSCDTTGIFNSYIALVTIGNPKPKGSPAVISLHGNINPMTSFGTPTYGTLASSGPTSGLSYDGLVNGGTGMKLSVYQASTTVLIGTATPDITNGKYDIFPVSVIEALLGQSLLQIIARGVIPDMYGIVRAQTGSCVLNASGQIDYISASVLLLPFSVFLIV